VAIRKLSEVEESSKLEEASKLKTLQFVVKDLSGCPALRLSRTASQRTQRAVWRTEVNTPHRKSSTCLWKPLASTS
jgi:hypothetical protein